MVSPWFSYRFFMQELSDLNKHMRTVHGEYRRKSKITPLTPSPSKPTTITSSQQISPTSFGKPVIAAAISSMADVKTIPSIHDVSSLSLNKVIRQLNTEDLARQVRFAFGVLFTKQGH